MGIYPIYEIHGTNMYCQYNNVWIPHGSTYWIGIVVELSGDMVSL